MSESLFILPGNPQRGWYSCISGRYEIPSRLVECHCFPGFTLGGFPFLQLSFSLLLTNYGAYQGSLLGTLFFISTIWKTLFLCKSSKYKTLNKSLPLSSITKCLKQPHSIFLPILIPLKTELRGIRRKHQVYCHCLWNIKENFTMAHTHLCLCSKPVDNL